MLILGCCAIAAAPAAGDDALGWAELLTVASVAALGLGLSIATSAGPGVDHSGLPDDEAVLDQLPHILPCK